MAEKRETKVAQLEYKEADKILVRHETDWGGVQVDFEKTRNSIACGGAMTANESISKCSRLTSPTDRQSKSQISPEVYAYDRNVPRCCVLRSP